MLRALDGGNSERQTSSGGPGSNAYGPEGRILRYRRLPQTTAGAGAPESFPGTSIDPTPKREHSLSDAVPFVSQSKAMKEIREIVEAVAPTSATVLIRGESGVGKELVARAIASASARPVEAFVK